VKNYNRNAAVAYAARWATGRNPAYYDYSAIGGDCTNFASQTLYAGSGIMDYTPEIGWYYIDANNKAPAWTGVEFLFRYLTEDVAARPGPVAEVTGPEAMQPGDLIQLSFDGNRFSHTLVVMISDPVIFVSAHSEDQFLRRLDSYSYNKIRYLHIDRIQT